MKEIKKERNPLHERPLKGIGSSVGMQPYIFPSYTISHGFDRMLSTMFQPIVLDRPRVPLPFARVVVASPSPIAPLKAFRFLDTAGFSLSS